MGIRQKIPYWRIPSIYALFGALWILTSDRLLAFFTNDAVVMTRLQTYKGWFFIAITTLLILFLMGREEAKRQKIAAERNLSIERELEARAEVEAEQVRYRDLFDNNPLPLWVYDRETLAFLAVNNAAVEHYGYSREEFLSMTIKEIRPAEDIPALLSVINNSTEVLRSGVWRHKKKDDSLIDVEVTRHNLQFNGRNARLSLANDISDRKRAEEQLQRQYNQLAALRTI